MGLLLWGALLLCQADPRDRLFEAIRETRLDDVQKHLAEVAMGDGARGARTLIAALPKARERLNVLLAATMRARENYESVGTQFQFYIKEEVLRERALEAAAGRIRETVQRALEGERVYDSVFDLLGFLKPEAAAVIAGEAERTEQWLLKCELIDGLGALGARGALAGLLRTELAPVHLAALLDATPSDRGLEFLRHPQWQVRITALDALRKTRVAVGPVVDAMLQEDLRFRKHASGLLARLTETELPADPQVWADWWTANREDFEGGTYLPRAPRTLPGPGRTAFYDIPVHSSRVCFVIDRSRSMREQNRFEDAKIELKRLLDSLPDGARLNIVFFGGSLSCFAKAPRALDARSRREAAEYVDRMGMEPATDLYAALERALSFVGNLETGRLAEDGIDTIVVLSDGQATTGRIIDDELIAREIGRRARYLRPVIHGVSLGSEARSLKLLAERTGGEFRLR